jgi:hypothetical protein
MRRLVMMALVALMALSAVVAHAETVYSIALDGRAAVLESVSRGGTVRFIGASEALVAGDAGLGVDLRRSGLDAEIVCDTGDWENFYICYPGRVKSDVGRYGEILWEEPNGAMLVGLSTVDVEALRAVSFMIYSLPVSVDAVEWFDNCPAPLVDASQDERAVRGFVGDVIDAISADSLMAHVERLSMYPDGELRTRYVRREECLDEARTYIVSCLERYGAVVDTHHFGVAGYTCEGGVGGPVVIYPAENIVATLPGSGRLQGSYVVCAHYDAIASNSFPDTAYFWWCDNPAPGADDNATGVATVLEMARVLIESEASFPFDIRFILFSGEELGLLGSRAYADSVAAVGDTIYAALNVDMIGYKLSPDHPDTCHLVTNAGSRWFADWILDTAETVYPSHFDDLEVLRIDQALMYSDHGSFWMNGYDALIAIEHWNPRERNPYYHTLQDTFGSIQSSQFAAITKMCTGALARLNDPDSRINLVVYEGDVTFTPDEPGCGTTVTIGTEVHVYGPEEYVDATLELWDGDVDSGELVSSFNFARTMGGGEYVEHDFIWLLGEDDVGEHELSLRVTTTGTDELTMSDNVAVVTVAVTSADLRILSHYAYPNPAPDAGEVAFRYELSSLAKHVVLEVFDLTGQKLGGFEKYNEEHGDEAANAGTLAGWNTVAWGALDGVGDPASGVYIYRVSAREAGAVDPADIVTGKFAIVR